MQEAHFPKERVPPVAIVRPGISASLPSKELDSDCANYREGSTSA